MVPDFIYGVPMYCSFRVQGYGATGKVSDLKGAIARVPYMRSVIRNIFS